MDHHIFIKEIKLIIHNISNQRAPGPDEFTGEFYQTLQEEIVPIFYNLLQKKEAEGICLNSFEDCNTLIQIPKTFQEKKIWTTISHDHSCKTPQQNINLNPTMYM